MRLKPKYSFSVLQTKHRRLFLKKIQWCVIGAGGIADRRAIPALLSDKHNELVAVMNRTESEAERLAEKYGAAHFFTDAEEMFKTVKCDAVYIATPVFCHFTHAMTALKYGINVLLEKPMAMKVRRAQTSPPMETAEIPALPVAWPTMTMSAML